MEKNRCRFLQMTLRLQEAIFSKASFLEDVKNNITEGRDVHAWALGSHDSPATRHAHLVVDLEEKDTVTIVVSYHFADSASEETLDDVRPPYFEDCAQWLSGFIQTERVIADLQTLYSFDEQFVPKLKLPFPLLNVMEEAEIDATITGVAIRFQSPMNVERVIIERFAKNTLMSIYSTQEVILREFTVDNKLDEFAPVVQALIRERKNT